MEEVGDGATEAHGVSNRSREVGDVLFETDHRKDPAESHGAEVVEGDRVLEEGSLYRVSRGGARRVVLYGVEDHTGGLRREITVATAMERRT